MSAHPKLHSVHALRFFAALAVVVHHIVSSIGDHIELGGAGVDVFFVISGLVIGLSMLANEEPQRFMLRRVIRVMPFYWVMMALYMAVSRLTWGNRPDLDYIGRSIFLWPVFGGTWVPVYYPAWSLEYEMFFYGLATVALFMLRRNAFPVVALFMVGLAISRVHVLGTGRFFGTEFMLEFAFGLALAAMVSHRLIVDRRTGSLLTVAAIAMFAFNYNGGVLRPLAWGLPGALLIMGLMAFDSLPVFRRPAAVLGGDISYALYLTHISTIQAWNYIELRLGGSFMHHKWSALLIAAPSTVVVAIAARKWIEQPMLKILSQLLLKKREPAMQGMQRDSIKT